MHFMQQGTMYRDVQSLIKHNTLLCKCLLYQNSHGLSFTDIIENYYSLVGSLHNSDEHCPNNMQYIYNIPMSNLKLNCELV